VNPPNISINHSSTRQASDQFIVTCQLLSKTYIAGQIEVHALRGVSIALRSGEFVGLTGPSGCGKSTLLNILGMTEPPTAGVVYFRGAEVNFSNSVALATLRRSQIGYLFQYFNLLPTLTAQENVALMLLLNATGSAAAMARAAEVLKELGLESRIQHLPQALSGGEMQRVALARAIVHKPALVLADEPTGNLDSKRGQQVLGLLSEIAANGTAILMATHSSSALERCSRVISMLDGFSTEAP